MNFLGTECPQCNSACWLQNKIERLDSLSSQPASLTAILSLQMSHQKVIGKRHAGPQMKQQYREY